MEDVISAVTGGKHKTEVCAKMKMKVGKISKKIVNVKYLGTIIKTEMEEVVR